MNPTQTNVANPTPYNINLPGEGQTFRAVGDNNGSSLYTIKGGQLSSLSPGTFQASTDLRMPDGSIIKGGSYTTQDIRRSGTPVDPGYTGTYGSAVNTGDWYNQQNGSGKYEALPTFNIADIQGALDKAKSNGGTPNFGGSQTMNGPSVAADTQAQLAGMPQNNPNQTVNQVTGALPAQAAALQSQSSAPSPFGANYGPLGVPNQPAAGGTSQQQTAQGNALAGSTDATIPPPSTGATGASPNSTNPPDVNSVLQNYLSTLTPTSQESQLQQQLNGITSQQAGVNASRDLGIQGVSEQPIATPFLTGQSAAITNRAAVQQGALSAQAVPLQQQLALQQAKRQSAMDVAKATLDYSKPTSLSMGSNLVNPLTGKTIAQGQDYSAKLGANDTFSLMKTYPDAGILPTDDATTAAAKAAASGSFGAKNTNLAVTKDAFGNIITYDKKGNQVYGNASGASSGGSTGGGAYKAGQLTALLNSQGKPTDDASLAAMYKAAGLQGNYVNDTAHNGPLYAALGGQPSSSASGSSSGSTVNTPKANADTVTQASKKLGAITAAHTKLQGDLQAIAALADKVNATGIPNLDGFINGLNNQYSNNPDLVQFKHLVTSARGDYAVINSGGSSSPDQGDQDRAAGAIPANGNAATYQALLHTVDGEAQRQISAQQSVIGQFSTNKSGGNQSSSSPGGSGSNPLGI